jgi:redox-sensitive bicupin YhaK (pirin superfamily)
MRTRIPADERGHADHGWLDTRHTFSFADYYDPQRMGFRSLRVINDDLIAGGTGFGLHGHRDMEIISWIARGALEHKDSLGSGAVLRPGDAQVMSAGRGIRHSEFNPDPAVTTRLLQIWIEPTVTGIPPAYADRNYPLAQRTDRWQPIASRDGRDGSLRIHADADVLTTTLTPGTTLRHDLASGRHAWVQVVTGGLTVDGVALAEGDGLAISGEPGLTVTGGPTGAEILLFDLG